MKISRLFSTVHYDAQHAAGAAGSGKVPERADVDDRNKWDLEKIYPSAEAWEIAFSDVAARLAPLSEFGGKIGESSASLLSYLREAEALSEELGKLYVYANMKSHEDMRLAIHQELADRAENLAMRYSAAVSFFQPEILAMPDGRLKIFLAENEELKRYNFYFESLLREKEHVLSKREEELLAQTQEMRGVAHNAFSMLTDADMKFPTIRDENGNDVELTEERFYRLSRSRDRSVRKAAFEGILCTYGLYKNAFGALYSGSVKGDIFYSTARRYKNSLDAALFPDNVPESVYDNVVRTANEHLSLLHEYMALRKRALGLDELHLYDLNVPLSDEPLTDVLYEDALNMVHSALTPLGPDYAANLKRGFSERWIDVYENQGKRKGAYSWGSYGTPPYVLLNYNGTLRDVFTLAHEMGHSLHSWYSRGGQPQVYADYTILLAEVASTTNEALLLEHLLTKSGEKPEPNRTEERKWLLTYYFNMVRTTFFRQAMFAEYERETHRRAERGDALTPNWLSGLWGDLCAKYHGPVVIDEPIKMEWARIPHFYSAFYVYKYVTGFTAAGAFAGALLDGERTGKGHARESYINFLKSGSSAFSLDILKKAGVDLESPEPFERTMATFKDKLKEAARLF